MAAKAEAGTLYPERSRSLRGKYTPSEIAALRADPLCVLPNRTLAAQWQKCRRLGICRDQSLNVPFNRKAQKSRKRSPAMGRRKYFRRRIRENPEPTLAALRQLARGHQHAEDLILEGFATVLRLAIPAAEAFKLAKAEVNRTSAQPFREQSFNPDIDYAARETGRQVSRASDLRAARGDG